LKKRRAIKRESTGSKETWADDMGSIHEWGCDDDEWAFNEKGDYRDFLYNNTNVVKDRCVAVA
jgi:hypothetical protein